MHKPGSIDLDVARTLPAQKENQRADIEAAKRRGKHLGRPRKLTPEQICYAKSQIDKGEDTYNSMATIFNVDPTTVWRALRRLKNQD